MKVSADGHHREPDPAALDIFLSWLLWLPDEEDPATAAQAEIDKIDRMAGANATTAGLRDLLHALTRSRRLN
jgi:hypothetical protein